MTIDMNCVKKKAHELCTVEKSSSVKTSGRSNTARGISKPNISDKCGKDIIQTKQKFL